VPLREEEAAAVFAQLQDEVCDPTGAAIGIIDHAPWPTENNRGQRRAYGSVFKAAAIRWGIYLDREEETLYLQAGGNNLAGVRRTPVFWDAERLELHLVEPLSAEAELANRVEDFLKRNPGASTTVIRAGVQGHDKTIDRALADDERFAKVPPKLFGKPRNTNCWARIEDVPDLLRSADSTEGDR
jgi:hypothetical protein